MLKTKIQRKHLYTPLRYPGGKTSLFGFFDEVVKRHGWSDLTYIEPYAGGAGAALTLLILGKVKGIVINDFDPAIYSFWKAVVEQPNEFIAKIATTPTTVEEWERQKLIYKKADASNPLELGFATFFLNRTNRSGILNAGPIGGKDQTGNWKIDARYNREALAHKVSLISSFSKQITVSKMDGLAVIEKYANSPSSFFYIDPPYFVKGTELYLNAFKLRDHEDLATKLNKYFKAKWLLTYDNAPEILELYHGRNYVPFDLRYSAHHNTKSGSELMVFSDAIKMDLIQDLL